MYQKINTFSYELKGVGEQLKFQKFALKLETFCFQRTFFSLFLKFQQIVRLNFPNKSLQKIDLIIFFITFQTLLSVKII